MQKIQKKAFLIMFLTVMAFLTIPAYETTKQIKIMQWEKQQLIQKQITEMTRALWPGHGGAPAKDYTAAITPLSYNALKKVKIVAQYYPLYAIGVPPLGVPIVKWVIRINYWIYDEATEALLYVGSTKTLADKPHWGTVTVHSVPSPFDPNTFIYTEYYKTANYMRYYSNFYIHQIEGKQATLSTVLRELIGRDGGKPKYFHLAEHGGIKNNIPYIKLADGYLVPREVDDNIRNNYLGETNPLNNTKLVYLAACYSLANRYHKNYYDNFVMPILKHGGANAMIGFTGEVNSFVAYLFADEFYKNLLEKKEYLTDALSDAKKSLSDATRIFGLMVSSLSFLITRIPPLLGVALDPWTAAVIVLIFIAVSFTSAWWVAQQLSMIRMVTQSDLRA